MSVLGKLSSKLAMAAAVFAFMAVPASAAVDAAGTKFDDTMNVGGKDLVLNGAGVRTKFTINVYSAGLYLPQRATTTDAVLKTEGPRRMRMVMLRELGSEDFGNAFMAGLNNNVSDADKSRIVSQISKIGELFAQVGIAKRGDIIDTDWTPGVGTQCYLNGKKIGGVLPDPLFFNSLLRIWLGDKPVDPALKAALLAAPPKK
jgi:hypothetical protein